MCTLPGRPPVTLIPRPACSSWVPAFAACASKALYAAIQPVAWIVYSAGILGMGSRPHSTGTARCRRAHSFSTGLRMCSILPWYGAEYSRLLSEWVLEGRHSYNGGRLSTTANQPALRLLSPLVPPSTRPRNHRKNHKPYSSMCNSPPTSHPAKGHGSEVHSAQIAHSPHPWGISRAERAYKHVKHTHMTCCCSLSCSGARPGRPRLLDTCSCC